MGEGMTISKNRWTAMERRLLRSGKGRQGFVLVAIDAAECGISRLRGTHLKLFPNIYSGSGGKRYKTSFKIEKFLEHARDGILTAARKGDKVIVFGPGETKRRLVNFCQKYQAFGKLDVAVADGIDSGGEDGIYVFTRSQSMRELMAGSKLAHVSSVIDEIMMLASKKSRRFSMGYAETLAANRAGAVGYHGLLGQGNP